MLFFANIKFHQNPLSQDCVQGKYIHHNLSNQNYGLDFLKKVVYKLRFQEMALILRNYVEDWRTAYNPIEYVLKETNPLITANDRFKYLFKIEVGGTVLAILKVPLQSGTNLGRVVRITATMNPCIRFWSNLMKRKSYGISAKRPQKGTNIPH